MTKEKKRVRIESINNKAILADQCEVAESFMSRLKGLLGRKTLEEGEGLFISPCNDIHMWFMSIPIDVVFIVLDRVESGHDYFRVTSVHPEVRPWRFLPLWDHRATDTLELPVGTIQRCGLATGDILCIG